MKPAVAIALVLWFVSPVLAENHGNVTLQVRSRDGYVRFTRTAALTDEARQRTLKKFLQSLAANSCERLKAGACWVQEIYRVDPANGVAQPIFRCESPGCFCDPAADMVRLGDIIVFQQGAYCCGF